ncbi:uncharacterized protein LOC141651786 [Silene latifolia]|uniref:uncharacterized protein LOC141651786 n=1 Tax=Silene latifolia TaxID=37657 RepID=UPI003D789FFC
MDMIGLWEQLLLKDWTKIVWNEWNVPKHSFNSWLIMQGGLNTKVRLFSYGCFVDDCVSCVRSSETNEHLFINANSVVKFKSVEDWIERPFPSIVSQCFDSEDEMEGTSLGALVLRYTIWHQRNLARTRFSVTRPVIVAERMEMVVQQQIRKFTDRRGGQHELNVRTWTGFC